MNEFSPRPFYVERSFPQEEGSHVFFDIQVSTGQVWMTMMTIPDILCLDHEFEWEDLLRENALDGF